MSTRATMDYAVNDAFVKAVTERGGTMKPEESASASGVPPFSLFTELFENGVVYLRVDHCPTFPLNFEATTGHVTLGLPLALWQRIAKAIQEKQPMWYED